MSSQSNQTEVRVLIVCMGNICRSPMAHGVVRQRLAESRIASRVVVDSAGTHGYHIGDPPDERAQAAAHRRGVDITDLRARQVSSEDFELFDLILAMDEENLETLREIAGPAHYHKVQLFLDFAGSGGGVPDPYYGDMVGFERVLDMVEEASDSLIRRLEQLVNDRR
jgi:protein-tyrosine phosphatase